MPDDLTVRDARPGDVDAICSFGAAHIPSHYAPLIGRDAAQGQVSRWWNRERISVAVEVGQVVVAETRGTLIGVAERGEWEGVPVIWKLYVHPDHRGRRIGPKLIRALIAQLPATADRLQVEVFAANRRAQEFYAREGFAYLRTDPDPPRPALTVVWRKLDLTGRAPAC